MSSLVSMFANHFQSRLTVPPCRIVGTQLGLQFFYNSSSFSFLLRTSFPFSVLSFFYFEIPFGGGGNPVVYNGRHARASVPAEGRKTKYIREDPEEEDEDQERQELGLPQRKNKPQSRVSSLPGNTPALT